MTSDRRASSVCCEEAKFSYQHQRMIPQHVHQSAWDEKIQEIDLEIREDRGRINFLTGLVKKEELGFFGLSDELEGETPDVRALNRGLNTIHNRMMFLRRRYACLMKLKKAETGDGRYIQKKLKAYNAELVIIINQIVDKGGLYCITPDIFSEDIVLID